MPTWLNRANIYIFLWCLYATQGVLIPKGSILTQLLLVILLAMSLYYCFVAVTRYKLPEYFHGLNLLLSLFFVYGIYLILGGYNVQDYSKPVDSFNYLKTILISLLPIYTFFVFFKENRYSKNELLGWILILFVVAMVNYYKNQQEMLLRALLIHSERDEFTNNAGYQFLALIPACVLLYKKARLQYLLLACCTIFMIMAMKRGAIIIGAVCLVWFLWFNLKKANVKKKIGIVALSLFFIFLGFLFVQNKMENSLYFQSRVEKTFEGNTSHRDELYGDFAHYFWNKTDPFQFILGSGANATLKVSYNYAHNDWLEIAVNQGVLGLFIYMIYWSLFARTVFFKEYEPHIRFALQLLFVIYFMKSLISMSYGSMSIAATFVLGYCLAQERKNEQIVDCHQVN